MLNRNTLTYIHTYIHTYRISLPFLDSKVNTVFSFYFLKMGKLKRIFKGALCLRNFRGRDAPFCVFGKVVVA